MNRLRSWTYAHVTFGRLIALALIVISIAFAAGCVHSMIVNAEAWIGAQS